MASPSGIPSWDSRSKKYRTRQNGIVYWGHYGSNGYTIFLYILVPQVASDSEHLRSNSTYAPCDGNPVDPLNRYHVFDGERGAIIPRAVQADCLKSCSLLCAPCWMRETIRFLLRWQK